MKVGGVVEALVELMREGSEDAKEAAADAVRNLAANNDENKVWVSPALASAIWEAQAHPRHHSEVESKEGIGRPVTCWQNC